MKAKLMKKLIIILLLLSYTCGCGTVDIKPGNYVIVNKNTRPIYLIDINTGERLVELDAEKFYVSIKDKKKIASFTVEFTNFNTESNSVRYVELGFFNGKIKQAKDDLPVDSVNESQDAIIIQPTMDLISVDSGEKVGVTLSSYGPILYNDHRDGCYYFYLGVNYLKVLDTGITIIKRPTGGNEGQIFEGELCDYAFGFLTIEQQLMINDRSDVYEQFFNIGAKGVTIYNRDLSREIVITNQDIIVVTYLSLYDETLHLEVYLEANSYSFLGIKFITLEIDNNEVEPE
jgi:hypothetical protein